MTTATTTTTDRPGTAPAVAQAEQEANEAEQLLAALEERVRDGDEHVTAQQLADARELGRFAKLRAEAARRKADRAAAREAERQRADRLAQAAATAAPGGPLDADTLAADTLAAAYATARDAVRAFVTASEAYNAAIGEAARLLAAADVPDSSGGEHPAPGTMARWGTRTLRLADGTALTATGTGLRLAVLLDDLDRESGGIPTGDFQPPFARTPLTEQAARGRNASPNLPALAEQRAGAAK
ncbi:hypothetical protein DDQ41_04055 [Streptomyces spongiicola]|uniref:Uncharacterized protein n=1 Tax=Streptomyces spongiicola TaxID=1690221 RepID=A0ABN5KC61_9ACTN|nr:hypothetical protein [Streptomyces spongiicola]AWK08247.1 hypothetical protein DDQ41_04055 [Streptomyces spongiicola]